MRILSENERVSNLFLRFLAGRSSTDERKCEKASVMVGYESSLRRGGDSGFGEKETDQEKLVKLPSMRDHTNAK